MVKQFPKIYGMNKTSEACPDVLSLSIFLSGCNLRCPYCMNCKLVMEDNLEEISFNIVKEEAKNHDWVSISGGEPLIHEEKLINLIKEFKSMNLKVCLSTNGILFENLEECIKLVDYVCLDIKTSDRELYKEFSNNIDYDIYNNIIVGSLPILQNGDIDFEIRTTLYPLFIKKKDILNIGWYIRKQDKWVLQPYREAKNMMIDYLSKDFLKKYDFHKQENYTLQEINELYEIAKQFSDNVEIKYV